MAVMPQIKVASMFAEAADIMTKQQDQIDALIKENQTLRTDSGELVQLRATNEKQARCEKIAQALLDKGHLDISEFNEKVAELMQVEDLTVTERAIEMMGVPDSGLGTLELEKGAGSVPVTGPPTGIPSPSPTAPGSDEGGSEDYSAFWDAYNSYGT